MTEFDALVDELAEDLDGLSRPAQAAFFVSAGLVLLDEYQRWAAHQGESHEHVLQRCLDVAATYATSGLFIGNRDRLIEELEEFMPPGDAPDAVSSTYAPECWICVDTAVQIAADETFTAGRCVEYALQPMADTTSEWLFGISPVGSGPGEDVALGRLLTEPPLSDAIEFCRWAIAHLASRPEPTPADVEELTRRAVALVP